MQICAASQLTAPQAVPSGAVVSPQPACGSHTPSWHWPSPGQGGAGGYWQPAIASHTLRVQALPSSQAIALPTQLPAWQVASFTQTECGSQAAPSPSGVSTQ